MKFEAIVKKQPVKEWIVYSIGGGDLSDGTSETKKEILYDKSTMKTILEWSFHIRDSLNIKNK
jgi:L-serine dehydratase